MGQKDTYQALDLPQVGEWSVGLFDCFGDMGLCCDVYWCGVCQMARQHDAVLNGKQDSFNGGCCLALTCCGFVQVCHTCHVRKNLRQQHGIAGSGFKDCLAAMFCGPCTLCQTHKQLRSRGMNPGVTCCDSSTPVQTVPQAQAPMAH